MSKKQTSLGRYFALGKRPSDETEEKPMTAEKKKATFNRKYQESNEAMKPSELAYSSFLLQRTKLRVPTDSPLLASGIVTLFVFVIMLVVSFIFPAPACL